MKKMIIGFLLALTLASTAEAVEIIINLGGNQRPHCNGYRPTPPPMVYQGTQYYYDSHTSRYSNGYVVQDVTDHHISGTRPRSGRVYREVDSQVWWNGHYINP